MRRLKSFIFLILAMIGLVAFNLQAEVGSLSWSQEYDKGTEVVYSISLPDSDVGEKSNINIDNVIEVMGSRLEKAGATNYKLESAESDYGYEVRVILGSRNTADVDNILKSTSSSGEFAFFTTNGMYGTTSEPIDRGEAEVYYDSENQAYIRLEVTSEVNDIATQAKEQVGNGLLVLWQNKPDSVDYEDLSDSDYISTYKNLTASQLQSRVLAVIDLSDKSDEPEKDENGNEVAQPTDYSNLYYDEDDEVWYLTFAAEGYSNMTESTTKLNSGSVRALERLFNDDELKDLDIQELYRVSASSSYGNLANTLMIIAGSVAVIVMLVYMFVKYKLMALSGVVGLLLTFLLDFFLMNVFSLTINPVTILAIVLTMIMGINMLNLYYQRTKDEAYSGRALNKAADDGARKVISTCVDTVVMMFVLNIINAIISRESIKIFSIIFIFSSWASAILVFMLVRLLDQFFFNSPANNNLKLFGINPDMVADLDGNRKVPLKKNVKLERYDPEKPGKAMLIASVIGIIISAGSLITWGIVNNSFNYSTSETITRVEVKSADEHLFENDDTSKDSLSNFVYFLENSGDNIKVTSSWAVTNQSDPYSIDNGNFIYFYADLDKEYSSDLATFTKLEEKVYATVDKTSYNDVVADEYYEYTVSEYTVKNGAVKFDFLHTFILMGVICLGVLVYYTLRYRYTLGLSLFATLTTGGIITTGIVSLTRIPVSSYVGVAMLAGLILNMLLVIPFGNRVNQMKNESKVKVTTSEQRRLIFIRAYQDQVPNYVLTLALYCVVIIVAACISPYQMLPIYGTALISALVNGAMVLLGAVPLASFLEKKLLFSGLKARQMKAKQSKRERIARENRNKGSEPEEIIIPGIND